MQRIQESFRNTGVGPDTPLGAWNETVDNPYFPLSKFGLLSFYYLFSSDF